MSRNCPRGDSIKNWRAQEPRVKYFLFSGNENREKETVPETVPEKTVPETVPKIVPETMPESIG